MTAEDIGGRVVFGGKPQGFTPEPPELGNGYEYLCHIFIYHANDVKQACIDAYHRLETRLDLPLLTEAPVNQTARLLLIRSATKQGCFGTLFGETICGETKPRKS